MRKKLGWRFALIGVVVLLAIWYLYPTIKWATLDNTERKALMEEYRKYDAEHPKPTLSEDVNTYFYRWYKGDKTKAVNLGLDLQGGMHLVLQVDADAAITNEMVRLKNNLRRYFIENRVIVGSLSVENHTIVIPVTASVKEEAKKSINQYSTDLDVEDAGDKLLVSMSSDRFSYLKTISVKQALETMRNRIDEFGVAEPVIQRQGNDRILVQLPGVEDPERVIDLIGRTAQLSFHIVVDGPAPEYVLLGRYNQRLPANTFLAPLQSERIEGQQAYYLLEREASVTGADLVDARIGRDELGSSAVDFQLSRTGSSAFGKLTEANLHKQLAIVLDGVVESAPSIRSKITTYGQITGQFTPQEAEDLAIVLRSGALPAPVRIIEQRTVGPTLGIESIKYGFRAALASLFIVAIFMIVYYRVAGAIANLALILNLVTLVAFLAYFRATLTLPGIGGIILTIGMAVDANVLVFERIREELRKGKTLRSAIDTGYAKAFLPIFDGNLTTLITAAVLFQFGTGPVKGFAVTLTVGLIISLFTALFVTRTIFDLLTQRRWISQITMLQALSKPSINFISVRYVAIAISLAVILIGMGTFVVRGNDNLGVDFAPGTVLHVRFDEPVTTQAVRSALSAGGLTETVVQQYGSPRDILIRTTVEAEADESAEEHDSAVLVGQKIADVLRGAVQTPFEVERTEEVGAAVTADLRNKALLAILYSTIGILIYVALRFEFRFGIGGVVALFHDVLITMGALALTGRQIQLPVVAALLTIFGYSINDTIVIFDRVRENMRLRRGQEFTKLLNESINETLSRTIITSLTVLFVVLVLFFVGSEVTRDFSFTLFIGLISGTYSTVFIAAPVVLVWQQLFSRRRQNVRQAKTQKKKPDKDARDLRKQATDESS
ncbi:MAG: protein translocase subunit SecD [Candidatus Abyssobacteria bacterium SURF_17]|uniref:Multifunctional fusion protein n=1 Tax=Candidatus Abyssobacteria bacterium SURF_17 TaxID=2093361 RepID=A0A419F641_9BACT|nr:MAG: protein translocase subunit SecD [Candidatus Abyssubacteria bacterium SURF_17]